MNMRLSNKNGKCTKVTMKEYGSLCKNADGISLGYQCLAESTFDRLEQFVLENRGAKDASEPLEFMTLSSRRGIGKIISAKNHVGVIAMKDGTQIEILPKLYSRDEESSDTQTKSIFIQMLRSIKDIPNKQFNPTSLQAEKNHLLDIFIRMFIEETITLVKRGLKSDYREHRDNEYFFKGKLQVAQHIKNNAAHKERFYIEYDEYSVNRPENRLIKTTIELLMRISGSTDNLKDLYSLMAAFDNIERSVHLEKDWANISTDRAMKEYQTILEWCRLFMSGQSFTPFKGEILAYALLFPMEKVFERYVAGLIQKVLVHPHVQIKTQDRTFRLFHNPARFQLKPDIVVQGPSGVVVLDTKWKLLSTASDYGISHSDMYQAYAYGKKYGATKVYLLYPWTPHLSMIKQPIGYDSGDDVEVRVAFLDLSLGKACVDALSVELLNTALGND
ncbi:McrC family protein [Paenibacillus tyrfis]|uniref:McrC family protein n=1 Tax=Paenibacillus tyrfis TaxID=1501230 RepID=UPI00209C82C9|nr:McrC family protein [Paenibacillus tyrfis]MCP1311894.1 McrC family protein [Paenibacillus tyrfis]